MKTDQVYKNQGSFLFKTHHRIKIILVLFTLSLISSCYDSCEDEDYFFEALNITQNKQLDQCEFTYSYCDPDEDRGWWSLGPCQTIKNSLWINSFQNIPCKGQMFHKVNCIQWMEALKEGYHSMYVYSETQCKSQNFDNRILFEFKPVQNVELTMLFKNNVNRYHVCLNLKNRKIDEKLRLNDDLFEVEKKSLPNPSKKEFEETIKIIPNDSVRLQVYYGIENGGSFKFDTIIYTKNILDNRLKIKL